MTTIIYDHKRKQIAVDSRCTGGGNIFSDSFDKVVINKEGHLCFMSGQGSERENYANLKHGDKVNVSFYCCSLTIKDGSVYYCVESDGVLSSSKLQYSLAIGSGSEFATGALDHGKSAREAVEYAITKDCYSGGKVRVFNLDGKEIEV